MNHTYQKNKILCILQVRGGSKGVPKKNIREVNGKPLMTWTIESAKKSGVFEVTGYMIRMKALMRQKRIVN